MVQQMYMFVLSHLEILEVLDKVRDILKSLGIRVEQIQALFSSY